MLSRLSFREKLMIVLFVPFLALVVVAGAGLRDRFTALRAQEQYGELSNPLQSLGTLSRALENESVATSWWSSATGDQLAPASTALASARAQTRAAGRAFRDREQQLADAGLTSTAAAALDATNRALDRLPQDRDGVDAGSTTVSDARGAFLAADDNLLTFGERVARDLEDPQASASESRVFALQREEHDLAREAGIYVGAASAGARDNFAPWVSAIAAQASERERFVAGATAAEATAF